MGRLPAAVLAIAIAALAAGCASLIGADFDRPLGGDQVGTPGAPGVDAGRDLTPMLPDEDGNCPSERKRCSNVCYSIHDPSFGCGNACVACVPPTNALATCNAAGTACDFTCKAGFKPSGSACVPIPTGWTTQTSSADKGIAGVWGVGAHVYVVGWGRTILHSTGAGVWTPELRGPSAEDLYSVWGSGAGDIYAVGSDGKIWHSTGNGAWSGEDSSGITTALNHVWGSGADDVYAVGSGGEIVHYDGAEWLDDASATTAELRGIWGSGPTNIFAVGDGGVIRHSTGAGSWTTVTSGTSTNLYAVWGTGPNDIYVVGENGVLRHSTNGTTWSSQQSGTSKGLWGIGGIGPNDIYAVGAGGVVSHSTGTGTWSPQSSGTIKTLWSVWPTATGTYAVGQDGTLLFRP